MKSLVDICLFFVGENAAVYSTDVITGWFTHFHSKENLNCQKKRKILSRMSQIFLSLIVAMSQRKLVTNFLREF